MTEKGTYQTIPQEQWLWTYRSDVEDEIYFQDKCTKYEQIRPQPPNDNSHSNMFVIINSH